MTQCNDSQLALAELDCRSILETVAGYAFIIDSRRQICWTNRGLAGRNTRQWIDGDVLQFVIEEHRSWVGDAIDRVLAGVPAIELEVQGAETRRWYSLRIVAIMQRTSVPGLLVHAIDVDDRKRTQTELAIEPPDADSSVRANLRRFELMADALPVLICYVDREGRYRYNNAAYARWFESSREAMFGRTIEEVVGPAAYAHIRNHVEDALSGRAVRFETTLPYRNAGVRRVVARYVPDVTEQGEVVGFHALVEDVSAQREAEAALREREEQLRQARTMEALGRLAGGVAHEFGNLLMTIVTGCAAVSEATPSDSAVATMVARVKRAAQRGASLTRQLSSFSRVGELPIGPLDIDALVGDVVVLLDRLLEARIEVEVDLGANAWIHADAGQIQQVLMNLALNARDAMPEGGRLRVVTKQVELTSELPGPHVLLSVADTGIGMDEATRQRIFDPFFTTKPPGVGTGLGLSTVYGIVRQAGGHIEVESAPGLGSVFRLYFPTCAPGSSEPDEP